jgi:hypothetical protein
MRKDIYLVHSRGHEEAILTWLIEPEEIKSFIVVQLEMTIGFRSNTFTPVLHDDNNKTNGTKIIDPQRLSWDALSDATN